MDGPLELRAASASDVEAIAELAGRCDRTYRSWAPRGWRPPPSVAVVAQWRARVADRRASVRVATGQGGIAGVVAWLDRGEVSSLFVDPEHWRQGIGTAMLAVAEAAIARHATLWVPEAAPARGLYERRGWRHDGTRRFFRLVGLYGVRYAKDCSLSAPAEAVRVRKNGSQV